MFIADLKGKVALITGASSGIGEATAKMLASHGVKLILCARRIDRLNNLATEIKNKYSVDVCTIELDMTKKESIVNIVNDLSEEFRNIDILINNAGLALYKDAYSDAELDDSIQMISVNCEGLITLTKVIMPILLKSDNPFIVNIGSVAADTAYAGGAIYCATKSFVEMFSDCIRIEVMHTPIRVSNIKPGLVNTEFSTVRFKGDKAKADSIYAGFEALLSADIACNIEYVLTRPKHVQIASITTMATSQGSTTMVHKK